MGLTNKYTLSETNSKSLWKRALFRGKLLVLRRVGWTSFPTLDMFLSFDIPESFGLLNHGLYLVFLKKKIHGTPRCQLHESIRSKHNFTEIKTISLFCERWPIPIKKNMCVCLLNLKAPGVKIQPTKTAFSQALMAADRRMILGTSRLIVASHKTWTAASQCPAACGRETRIAQAESSLTDCALIRSFPKTVNRNGA